MRYSGMYQWLAWLARHRQQKLSQQWSFSCVHRGSFLYFSGSKAFMQIMVREHNMLHRQAIILKAATYPLNDKDRQRLKASLHASPILDLHVILLATVFSSSLAVTGLRQERQINGAGQTAYFAIDSCCCQATSTVPTQTSVFTTLSPGLNTAIKLGHGSKPDLNSVNNT